MDCANCGATNHRLMGHEVRGVYDGVLAWSCLACGHAWPRFTESGRLAKASDQLVRNIAGRNADE